MKRNYLIYCLITTALAMVISFGCKKDQNANNNQQDPKTIIDIDGNVYKTVKLGSQTWMAENLRTTRFRNGTVIPTSDPVGLDIGSGNHIYQWVTNYDASLLKDYGRVYTWYTAQHLYGLCPAGWHTPSREDYQTLMKYLGADPGATYGATGGKLKATGTIHWNPPNAGATNESGFTAYGGGIRNADGLYIALKTYGYFMTTSNSKLTLSLDHVSKFYSFEGHAQSFAAHVRCIKD